MKQRKDKKRRDQSSDSSAESLTSASESSKSRSPIVEKYTNHKKPNKDIN